MRLIRLIKEEVVPLSSRENLILLVIISCIFQFTLFFTPALAEAAVSQAKGQATENDLIVVNSPLIRENASETAAKQDAAQPVAAVVLADEAEPIIETPPAPAILEEPDSPAPTAKILRTSVHVITAYNSEAAQTDDSPCITANGFNVCEHGQEDTVAANFLKFGTKVQIPELFGDRVFIVRDRMNKKHPNRVDVWMKERKAAVKFGVKTASIVVIE